MLTSSEAFPDFEQIDCSVSVCNPQLNSGILCSILLSYVDTQCIPYRRQASQATDHNEIFVARTRERSRNLVIGR